jgi:REP element-mobilizing transposase RayT
VESSGFHLSSPLPSHGIPPFHSSQLRFLNSAAAVDKSRYHLPHWQQDKKTYFITFRLKDSIPAAVIHQWQVTRDAWIENHPLPWSPETEQEFHHEFSNILDRHLDDCHGACILRQPANYEIVAQAFQHFNESRYLLHAFVVMPNQVHLLLSLAEEVILAKTIESWKHFTATRINNLTGNSGALWQKDYFDRIIRNWDHFGNVCRYIRRNPAKAKLPTGDYHLYLAPWIERFLS